MTNTNYTNYRLRVGQVLQFIDWSPAQKYHPNFMDNSYKGQSLGVIDWCYPYLTCRMDGYSQTPTMLDLRMVQLGVMTSWSGLVPIDSYDSSGKNAISMSAMDLKIGMVFKPQLDNKPTSCPASSIYKVICGRNEKKEYVPIMSGIDIKEIIGLSLDSTLNDWCCPFDITKNGFLVLPIEFVIGYQQEWMASCLGERERHKNSLKFFPEYYYGGVVGRLMGIMSLFHSLEVSKGKYSSLA